MNRRQFLAAIPAIAALRGMTQPEPPRITRNKYTDMCRAFRGTSGSSHLAAQQILFDAQALDALVQSTRFSYAHIAEAAVREYGKILNGQNRKDPPHEPLHILLRPR